MRRLAVLDAPSNLGLRPPTATSVPGVAKAPGALRDQGLLRRLGARDAGCLTPPRYDVGDWRPGDGVAHAAEINMYSRRLADRIGAIIDQGEFPVILGGDCSIVLGSALAMHRLGEAVGGRVGLVFVDGHSDFRHPGNASYVGAAAGEDLALVTGRGQANLTAIEGRRPYYRDIDVVVMGIRAQDEYRLDLQAAGIVTRPVPALRAEGAARSAQWAQEQLVDCAGYWVHLDVDVLDPAVMPAVDAPEPGGIAFPELEILLAGLVASPHCLGVEITVFDPDYDLDGTYAQEITAALVAGLQPAHTVEPRPDLVAARRDLVNPETPGTLAPIPPASLGESLAPPVTLPHPSTPTAPAPHPTSESTAPPFDEAPTIEPGAILVEAVVAADEPIVADASPDAFVDDSVPESEPVHDADADSISATDAMPDAEVAPGVEVVPYSGDGSDTPADVMETELVDAEVAETELMDSGIAEAEIVDGEIAEAELVEDAGPAENSPSGDLLPGELTPEDLSPDNDVSTPEQDPEADESEASETTTESDYVGESEAVISEAVVSEAVVDEPEPAVDEPESEAEPPTDSEADALAAAGSEAPTEADALAEAETDVPTGADVLADVPAGAYELADVEAELSADADADADADGEAEVESRGEGGAAAEYDADPQWDADLQSDGEQKPEGAAEPGGAAESEAAAEPQEAAESEDAAEPQEAAEPGKAVEPEPVGVADDGSLEKPLRPLGAAPLLDSDPLPATMPGRLRPRRADDFSLPAQRPAFEIGPETPADIT
jgi:arginase family enzyme